jgi:hypothetical protein
MSSTLIKSFEKKTPALQKAKREFLFVEKSTGFYIWIKSLHLVRMPFFRGQR